MAARPYGIQRCGGGTVATIYAEDGEALALVAIKVSDDGLTVALRRIDSGKGRLLDYYFGRGMRAVRLEAGGRSTSGSLKTRWLGTQRIWLIRVPQAERVPVWADASAPDAAGRPPQAGSTSAGPSEPPSLRTPSAAR